MLLFSRGNSHKSCSTLHHASNLNVTSCWSDITQCYKGKQPLVWLRPKLTLWFRLLGSMSAYHDLNRRVKTQQCFKPLVLHQCLGKLLPLISISST